MTWTKYNSAGEPVVGTAGVLGVPNGGTGVSTVASGNLLLGAGASPLTALAGGSTGDVVTWNGSAWAAAAVYAPQIVRVSDTKAQNTAQTTYTAGAYRTMDLNTEDYDPAGIASVSGNQVTQPAGKYLAIVQTGLSAGSIWRANIRLYNATAAAEIAGSESINIVQSAGVRVWLTMSCGFTLASTSAIELQVYSDINTVATGTLNRSGKSEVYSVLTFIRESQT